ncbi:serine hydrolase [Massilia sp. DJPM01]|uniref:serine hydrolase domain-containing protein n=1 Tax=Massilia sp. DJPM01 TaxID=3024404 RepID=UPI00259F6D2E|nr:serine hydrolase domain-containing protein [Massilia sp. DJPM01]MDM5180266.1 serine hydrolase [Massilia sp. DJPM01]
MKRNFLVAKCLMLGCIASLSLTAYADTDIDPASALAIEKIFADVNSPNKPALTVIALRNGKPIYQKAFGSANLEYKIPATVDTKFQVDRLAWEFIAFATFMLEEQGKIKLDEDVRSYLPEMPGFGGKITVRHLLSSTDGLHGYKVLKSLAGWESREPDQHTTIFKMIKNQKALNFKPGKEFSPGGDTRLVLLAKVVEAVSGEPFDVFCKNRIFSPLGMSNTQFVYDSGLPLENTAVPYRPGDNGAYQADRGNAPGPANLYTSVRDLGVWRSHLASQDPGVRSLVKQLDSPIRLDNGAVIKDMSSISIYGQQHIGQERGIPKVYQMGNSGGYASSIFRFPAQDFTVITLSSGLAYSGSYGMRLATVLLKDHFPEPESIDYSKIAAVKLRPGQLQKYEGDYWSSVRAISAKVHLKDGVLYFSRAEGIEGRELIPLGDSVFQLKAEGDDTFIIKFVDTKSGKNVHYIMGESDPLVYESYRPMPQTKDALTQFTGVFYSDELNSSFVLDASSGTLTASNIRVGAVKFKPTNQDMFSGDKRFMAGIKFIRGKGNEVTGFRIAVDEVRNLVFKKMPTS